MGNLMKSNLKNNIGLITKKLEGEGASRVKANSGDLKGIKCKFFYCIWSW